MRTVFALIALSLVASTPVLAQDAAASLTAAVAKKARYIAVAGGGGYSIDHINAATDGSVVAKEFMPNLREGAIMWRITSIPSASLDESIALSQRVAERIKAKRRSIA